MSGAACNGIGEYVKRLEKVAEECGEKPKKEAAQKDEFLRHKQRCYALLEEVRDSVRERQTLLKRRGNCHETIQKGHNIRKDLDELKKLQIRLQELHKKAQGKWSSRKEGKKEELQERYQVIRMLNRQITEANDLFVSGNSDVQVPSRIGGGGGDPNATLLGLRMTAAEEDRTRDLSGEESAALGQIKARDQEIDGQVAEIGNVVDRLNDIGTQIGSVADRHRVKAEAIGTDVEKADQDIQAMNKKIAEVIQYEKNTNFFCQLVLGLALLCCVGFIMQQMGMAP